MAHLLVQIGPLRGVGFRYAPRIDSADPAARKALALMAPRAVGLGATQITFVVVTALASTVGVGAVTAFTIAFTLLQIPIGVIGVPLGVVLFPSLSREAAEGAHAEFVGLVNRALRLLAFVMLPVAVLAAILRVESVALLFGDLDPALILLTADTLLAFLVGLVAHAFIAVLARAFYARQDTLTPVAVAVGAVVVNTTLAVILVGPYGLPGIALAIAIAAWLEAGALIVLLRRREGRLGLGAVAWVGARTALAAAVAGAIGALVHGSRRTRARPRSGDARPRRHPRSDRRHRARVGRVRGDVRGRRPRLADHRTALYRRDHGRRVPPTAPVVTAPVDADAWDALVESSDPGSYLQLSGWARVKAVNGWAAHRITAGPRVGAQVLVRRPRPLPWGFAYAPRGPVGGGWSTDDVGAFSTAVRDRLPALAGRVSHLRIDPEIEADGPHDPDGATRRALETHGWRASPPIQPASTRIIDLTGDEDALWGDLRKKWRQYVNKARSGGVRVVDAEGERLPEFHRIYRETAQRAGFLIRTEAAYRDVWEAYRPSGRARLLFARGPGRDAARDAVPRPLRAAGRRAVRRHDPGGRRHPGELPPQVGGHPIVARGRCDRVRPVGPGDRWHRPLQDRVRRPRGALHRGVGSRPRRARAIGVRRRGVGPGTLGRRRHGLSGSPGAAGYGAAEGAE